MIQSANFCKNPCNLACNFSHFFGFWISCSPVPALKKSDKKWTKRSSVECSIMKFHYRNSSSVQKPKFKDKEAIWEWKHKLRLIPNVLVLKLGGLSQSQRLENIFLGLLTDDLDQLDRDFFCPLSKNLVWPCLSICFVHKEICIIISGVCKNTGSSVLT